MMYDWKDLAAWLGGCAVAALCLWGLGAIIAQEQKNGQERALACITAGGAYAGGDCVYDGERQ